MVGSSSTQLLEETLGRLGADLEKIKGGGGMDHLQCSCRYILHIWYAIQ